MTPAPLARSRLRASRFLWEILRRRYHGMREVVSVAKPTKTIREIFAAGQEDMVEEVEMSICCQQKWVSEVP